LQTSNSDSVADVRALPGQRVAVVHEWLTTYAGAERVLEQMLAVLPHADLFAVVDFLSDEERARLGPRTIRTTAIQHLPMARRKYRSYLPLMPYAIEALDLSSYDVVISSSHCVAKGVLTGPDQLHICMCYSPMRYAWDLMHQYLRESKLDHGVKGWLARAMLHRLRIWDARTANGVDEFIAISQFVGRRIRKTYGRASTVIYPPVDTETFTPGGEKEAYYVTASRFVPYKKIDLLVEAFVGLPDRRLIVIGDGPDFSRIRAAAPPNVTLLGAQPLPVLRDYMRRARAFLFAAEEDFGIVCVEAQACGTPVIAFGKGGSRETVRGEPRSPVELGATGLFFGEQTVPAVLEAILRFEREASRFTAEACRAHAEQFASARFREEFRALLTGRWAQFSLR